MPSITLLIVGSISDETRVKAVNSLKNRAIFMGQPLFITQVSTAQFDRFRRQCDDIKASGDTIVHDDYDLTPVSNVLSHMHVDPEHAAYYLTAVSCFKLLEKVTAIATSVDTADTNQISEIETAMSDLGCHCGFVENVDGRMLELTPSDH